jgi:hypothetical protein
MAEKSENEVKEGEWKKSKTRSTNYKMPNKMRKSHDG